jgi:hypothetical protein
LRRQKPANAIGLAIRSRTSRSRSRTRRRRSSSSGLGGRTIEQACGSPRSQAAKVRHNTRPSILSLLARRRFRGIGIEAASATWL